MDVNDVSGDVVDAAMKVHSALGPGLLESAYEACLVHELRRRGHGVGVQEVLPVHYDGVTIECKLSRGSSRRRRRHRRAEGGPGAPADPRSSAPDLPEAQRRQSRLADQLQRPPAQGRHQAFGERPVTRSSRSTNRGGR